MLVMNVDKMSDQDLKSYDEMMVECATKVENFAPLAAGVWSDVLKELDRRGKVRLISGTYDNVGDALIERLD